jgi:hypothetical protein
VESKDVIVELAGVPLDDLLTLQALYLALDDQTQVLGYIDDRLSLNQYSPSPLKPVYEDWRNLTTLILAKMIGEIAATQELLAAAFSKTKEGKID